MYSIHLFNTQQALEAEYNGSGYTIPWLACVFTSGQTGSNMSYNKFDQFNGYDYVDLGLPSGALWATCNVGASSPEDVGDYYAYGEVRTKNYYDYDNYRFPNNGGYEPSKYNSRDNKMFLEPRDDAAHVNMGGDWRVPTCYEYDELFYQTNTGETTLNGVTGIGFTSKTDSSKWIFIPYNGYYLNGSYDDDGGVNFNVLTSYLDTYPYYAPIYTAYGYLNSSYSRSVGVKVRGIVSTQLDLTGYEYPVYGQGYVTIQPQPNLQPGLEYVAFIREPDRKVHAYHEVFELYFYRMLDTAEQSKFGCECLCFYMGGENEGIQWYCCNERDLYHGGD